MTWNKLVNKSTTNNILRNVLILTKIKRKIKSLYFTDSIRILLLISVKKLNFQ